MTELRPPINDETVMTLNTGDMVYITGKIYTARDAAHKKLAELLEAGKPFPFDPCGQLVFYAGPAPAKPGKASGSIGPTTATRMDLYAPLLISKGLKLMIGKGLRSAQVVEAMIQYRGLYFAAIGGAAALMARCVRSEKVIAFEELGTEAIRELEVEKLPVVVAIDVRGKNLYDDGRNVYYRRKP